MSQKQLAIIGGIGIGPVMIGLPMADVRAALGEPTNRFRKTPESPRLTDAYDPLGVHVYYDGADCVECVESFAVEGTVHLLDGLPVFDTPATKLIAAVWKKAAVRSEERGTSFVAPTLGLAFWRSDEEATTFETVLVASPAYFARTIDRSQF
jgi:hypothetical protein